MVGWSSLRLLRSAVTNKKWVASLKTSTVQNGGGGNKMNIEVSRWQYHKFKDLFHFYALVGIIPFTCIVAYCNIFIGPAKLAPIPEGYEPKHWEYYSHPITRFYARYIKTSYQQEYEKYMHYLYEDDEKAKMRKVSWKIQDLMKDRQDYQAYYYIPVTAKYFRETRDVTALTKHVHGENYYPPMTDKE